MIEFHREFHHTARRATVALAILAGLAGAALPAHATEPTQWRMATEYPANTMPGEGVSTFAAEVKSRTGGALEIVPSYDASAGIKSADIPKAVRDGVLDAGDAYGGALTGLNPVFALSSLPFVVGNIQDAQRLLDLARPLYAKAFEALGQHLLYVTPWPASGIWSSQPASSVDALRTLSIRTYDTTSASVMQAAGAKAEFLSFSELPARLKAGTINAALSSGDGDAGRKLWGWLPYFTTIEYAMPLSFATVSARAYAALSPEQRREVDQAAQATETQQWLRLRSRAEDNRQHMQRSGVTIEPPSAALRTALQRAGGQAVAEWEQKAGHDAADVLDQFRRTPAGAR
ncbi:TRAP transporter substrate-binding protein [Cupriavidus sp. BIS7]|uniref:TRAP transporter substrate-binding protein n=1 Tax=Cupriavidus sp. BIS7 TaxID=1217718 RepID=UPI0002E65FB1|nr:TRAP transporter substrate-binding protein [Cupriavidus sp. BIS7]